MFQDSEDIRKGLSHNTMATKSGGDENPDHNRQKHGNIRDNSTAVQDTLNEDSPLVELKSRDKITGSEADVHKPEGRTVEPFENTISDILLAMSLITIPMLIFSAVFIGIVFGLRVNVSSNPSGLPPDPAVESLVLLNSSKHTSDAFFVDMSSSRLLTVAS
jgi:hypothetical protein